MNRIQTLAKTAIEAAANDDLQLARQLAREQAERDVELSKELIAYAIDIAIDAEWRAGRAGRWYQRHTVDEVQPEVSFSNEPNPVLREGMRLTVDAAKDRLMDFEMASGKRLGESVKPDLLKAAARHEKQASTELVRAAWFKAIAAMLPDNTQPVSRVLREADLLRLQRRVMRQKDAA